MIPVLTPDRVKEIDLASPDPVEVLVARAGAAVARAALDMLGGGYGRRVVVVAGKGNNGADGRDAAARLQRRGVRVVVVDAADAPTRLPVSDLVIDAAFGTGFRGDYEAPDPAGAPVLAVDIPSGVDGVTGEAGPGAVRADRTVTFQGVKQGLLLGGGPDRAGAVEVADIGLGPVIDRLGPDGWLVEDGDVVVPERDRAAHKYASAVAVVAGSPGMMGAPLLVARAAMRTGCGYVLLGVPGAALDDLPAGEEAVGLALPAAGWASLVLQRASRVLAIAIGPGLGRDEATLAEVRRVVAESSVPVVVDADGLAAFAGGRPVGARSAVLLTPHDGEFERLAGSPAGADRVGAVQALAGRLGAAVLLKGPTTIVAGPTAGDDTILSASGTPRLATAGTGDVLTGVVAAFLALGLVGTRGAGLAAHTHGAAAALGPAHGFVASDLLALLPRWLSRG
jgi:NAD(P)H-hydrate epimerase